MPRIVVFVGSELPILAVSYSDKYFSFVMSAAEN